MLLGCPSCKAPCLNQLLRTTVLNSVLNICPLLKIGFLQDNLGLFWMHSNFDVCNEGKD